MRILFCGETFPSARLLLQQRLPLGSNDELHVWPDRGTPLNLKTVDVLIPMMFRIDTAVMDAAHVALIQQWGSGLEGVDLEAARARGIPVASVPASGSNAESVAEHVLLLILSLLRQLPQAQANVRAGILGAPLGRMLRGRSVCLYGLGATALSLARRLRALDVKLLGITRDPGAPKVAAFDLDECYSTSERNACLSQTEILVLCTRLCNETRELIDATVLAALPAGAYLLNAARGGLVEYDALYSALSSRRLAGAGLDVYWEEPIRPDDPLLVLPNVIATPHVAGVTDRSYGEIADAVAANIERLRRGKSPLNRVV
jgi:phosphoglycerate dehydrogenase-like enzyme